MAPPSSGSGPQRPRRQLRQGSRRGRKENRMGGDASRRRRIVRARRPPVTLTSPTSVAHAINGFDSPLFGADVNEVSNEAAYEEAVASAAAVVYADRNNDVDDGGVKKEDTSDNTDSQEISGSDAASNANGSDDDSIQSQANARPHPNANQFDVLMDDESSSSEDGSFGANDPSEHDDSDDGSEEDDSDLSLPELEDIINTTRPESNRFNVLMDDESSSDGSSDDSSDSDSDLSLPELEDIICTNTKAEDPNACSSDEENSGSDDEDEDEDENAAKCAVCFLNGNQSHKWRRLITLPCCGLEGKEESSSTRFCVGCILKMARTKPDPANSNEYPPWDRERHEAPVDHFYANDCQTDTRRFIECPRCRDILAVNIKKDKSHTGNTSTAKSISLRTPSFLEKCKYAGKKVGMAHILWKAAFLPYGFLSRESLSGRDSDIPVISRLAKWGILQSVSSKWNAEDLYKMNRDDHAALMKLFDLPRVHITEEFGESNALMIDLLAGMGCAALTHTLREYRLDRALRVINRMVFLMLFFKGYLPPFPHSMWQEWVVAMLIVFSASLIIQFIFIFILYAGIFFGVGLTVCFLLRQSNGLKPDFKSIVTSMNSKSMWGMLPLALSLYFTYKSASIATWLNIILPKAAIFIKEITWG